MCWYMALGRGFVGSIPTGCPMLKHKAIEASKYGLAYRYARDGCLHVCNAHDRLWRNQFNGGKLIEVRSLSIKSLNHAGWMAVTEKQEEIIFKCSD